MSPKKILLSTLLIPFVTIVGICLVVHPFHEKSSADEQLRANNERCDRARKHLREAQGCFADAIAGLRRVTMAQDRLVLGDRQLASRYIQQINEIRERLRDVSDEADRELREMVLPEINPLDED
jgi:hypothetical protein